MIKNLTKEQRSRLLLLVGGTVVVLAVIWFGLVSGMNASLDKLSKDILEQETAVHNADRLVRSKAVVEENLRVVSERLLQIEQTMAAGDMYAWVILTVNKFKGDRKLDIPQFSREVTGDMGMFPTFPYRAATFTLRGTAFYHDFGKFVADFENTFPYIRVQGVELEPALSGVSTTNAHPEMLSFKLDLVSLINPNPL